MAALLVRLGVADADHPSVAKRLRPKQHNFAGLEVGHIAPAQDLFAGAALI